MSNEAAEQINDEPEIEIVDEPAANDNAEVAEEADDSKKGDWVELSPEAQRKFNDMYKQTKMSDARNQFLLEANQAAMARIAELEARFNQTDHAEAERILQENLQKAMDEGDTARATKLMLEIADFKADAKLRATAQPKQQPTSIAAEYGLSDNEATDIYTAAMETDNSGNFLRPYLHEGHPQLSRATQLASQFTKQVQAELGYKDINEILSRVDKAMKQNQPSTPKPNNRAPDPMGGNLTSRNPRGTLKLSPAEKEIAQKLGLDPKVYAQSRDSLKK